jgi:hypothetical protein
MIVNFSTNAQNVNLSLTTNPHGWFSKNLKFLENSEESAKIQAAAGGRPTRLTPENQPSEPSVPEEIKQRKPQSKPLQPAEEATK